MRCLQLLVVVLLYKYGFAQVNTIPDGNSSFLDPFFDEEEFEENYPTVVSLKFHLKEDRLSELFTEVALQNLNCSFKDCNITLINIAEATQLSRYTSNDLFEAIKLLNITRRDLYNALTLHPVTVNSSEVLLQKFELTVNELYQAFVASLTTPSKTIQDVLNAVEVSYLDFVNSIMFGTDRDKLEILSLGNYSEANIEAALLIANKTGYDILQLVPLNKVFRNLNKLDPQELTNVVKDLGITSAKLISFYNYLNITAINFLSYPPFIRVITDYYDVLNSQELLGVLVSKTQVLTINKARVLTIYTNKTTQITKQYADFHVELVENPLVQLDVENVSLINPEHQTMEIAVVKVKNPFSTAFSNISTVYNVSELLNCTYVTKVPLGLYNEHIPSAKVIDNFIIVPKTNTTVFNLGSPLFCHEQLYGVATEETPQHIRLSSLLKPVPQTVTTTTPATTTTGQKIEVTESNTTHNIVITVSDSSTGNSIVINKNFLTLLTILTLTFLYV